MPGASTVEELVRTTAPAIRVHKYALNVAVGGLVVSILLKCLIYTILIIFFVFTRCVDALPGHGAQSVGGVRSDHATDADFQRTPQAVTVYPACNKQTG